MPQDLRSFKGMCSLRTMQQSADEVRWHQDVKPANILVKSGPDHSPYRVQFKLGDLGLSHFKEVMPSETEISDRDSCGTRAYGKLLNVQLKDTSNLSFRCPRVLPSGPFL